MLTKPVAELILPSEMLTLLSSVESTMKIYALLTGNDVDVWTKT